MDELSLVDNLFSHRLLESKAPAAFIADATDPAVLENSGAREVDVVVTAAEAVDGVVLCVSVLAEIGLKGIVARAASVRQASATRDLLEFATHFRGVPWTATTSYVGKALSRANVPRFELNVLGWFGADAHNPPRLSGARVSNREGPFAAARRGGGGASALLGAERRSS